MKNEYACTQERFLKDVKDHSMKIIKDDGVHRHISFTNNGSNVYRFDLITWPGRLCIDGDCGTYVFARIPDMFEFFRTDRNDLNYNKDGLSINPSYWGEKLQSIGRNAGYEEFDKNKFVLRVTEHFNDYIAPKIEDADVKAEVWEAIEEEVISKADEGEDRAYDAVYSFDYEDMDFVYFFDSGGTESYTFNYIWCLYAIVWGIREYDKKKSKINPPCLAHVGRN